MDPTVSMAQGWGGIPLTFKAPTYITVGPESFWTGGFGLAPGAVTSFGTIKNHGNIGILTNGITAIYSLKNWIRPTMAAGTSGRLSVLRHHQPKPPNRQWNCSQQL
jgi:hypothetical protein